MFKTEDFRFDLFVKKIFRTELSPRMKEDLFAFHLFGKLTLRVLRKEQLFILKSVTDRQNDFIDIRTIVEKEKDFDWQYLLDEVFWQAEHGDSWVLLDVEKAMKELTQYVFIPEKYLKQLYQKK